MKAAALAVVALAVALAPSGSASPGHFLTLPSAVESISADGGRVAFSEAAHGAHSCVSASIWTPSSGSIVPLRGDPCDVPNVFQGLTLAGTTAVWWDYDTGNHVYCEDVYTASLAHPQAHGLGLCDGTEGDTYYDFAGDASIVAVNDYTVCEADCTDANGQLLPDGDYSVEVGRVVGGKLRIVLKPVDFRRFLDAGNWRVATIEPKGVLTVFDTRGTSLWTVPGVTGVTAGWISGDSVVVQRGRSVQRYSPAGASGPARTLPLGGDVDDVAGGLVVYTVGASVHLLRLADGRDARLVTAKGLVGAQITPAGVYYAAGRSVTFVPIGDVLRRLH